ncbi:MAG: hypothetical protein QOF92_2056 [Pseudonocardiales bacterium]|jgi:hypothetical protein|nr:hypothetical protein [Jatrophihabitans sp.]MDT4929189.1 hypothetical protein [Pseudonocardiales bacterium]MDT4948807.1 hypothetical protein [Pseudonocardiales bacterium]
MGVVGVEEAVPVGDVDGVDGLDDALVDVDRLVRVLGDVDGAVTESVGVGDTASVAGVDGLAGALVLGAGCFFGTR